MCNVGASKPSDAGLYFQWGDTQGYTADQVGTGSGQKKFANDESDYKFGVYPNYSKYITTDATLDLEDDAAHANMGGNWHMPSLNQIEELLDNTTSTWTTSDDGVNGTTFSSKKDTSKSIFIPAAGFALDGSFYFRGSLVTIWSTELHSVDVDSGQCLICSLDDVGVGACYRVFGNFVRGVIG